MTTTDDSRDERDSFERKPGERLGVCLDIDGTVYRSGSVFVETLGFLPYADGISLGSGDERRLRDALAAVAEYHGGTLARAKWTAVFALLDALRTNGAGGLSESLLGLLADRRTGRSSGSNGRTATPEDYRTMQQTVLTAYAEFLRGKRRSDVRRAVSGIVDRRYRVDPRLRDTLDEIAAGSDAELALVTDMPEHVASAYARKLPDEVTVAGTTFGTDAEGRYTGEFDGIDKGEVVSRLRTDREWTRVVAAGDATVDLNMATEANVFLAVAGQGDVVGRLGEDETVSLDSVERDGSTPFSSRRTVVRVGRDEELASALRAVLPTFDASPGGC